MDLSVFDTNANDSIVLQLQHAKCSTARLSGLVAKVLRQIDQRSCCCRSDNNRKYGLDCI